MLYSKIKTIKTSLASIIFLLIFSSLNFIHAQSSGTPNDKDDVTCQDDNTIKTCPETCYEECRDTEFFLQHQESCKYVLLNKGKIKDSDECITKKNGLLGDCISKLKKIKPEEVPEGEEFDWIRVFVKDKPNCAASVTVLTAMNECLIKEGIKLEETLNKLKDKGYTDAKNLDAICKYTKEQFTADLRLSKGVENKIQILLEEFSLVSSCNQQFKKWIEGKDPEINGKKSEKTEGCRGDQVCIDNVKNLRNKLQEDLVPVTNKQVEMLNKLESIKNDSKSMKSVFGFFIIYGCNLTEKGE